MGKLTIGCFPGLVGNMSYDFALKLAGAAKDKGHDVDVWFSGNATSSVAAGQKHLKDYSTGETYIKALLEKGVNFCTCEACSMANLAGRRNHPPYCSKLSSLPADCCCLLPTFFPRPWSLTPSLTSGLRPLTSLFFIPQLVAQFPVWAPGSQEF